MHNCVACFKLTTHTCPRCDHVGYCSSKCVTHDFDRHALYECAKMTRREIMLFKKINTKLRARDSSLYYKHTGSLSRGFGIFAFRDLPKGKVLVRERPFVIKSSAVCAHVASIHYPHCIFDMFWSLDHDKTLKTTTEREHSIVATNGIFTEDGNVHLTYLISRFGTVAGDGAKIDAVDTSDDAKVNTDAGTTAVSGGAMIISDLITGAHLVVTTCDVLQGTEILLEVDTTEPCEHITCCDKGRFFKTYKK